MYPVRNFKIFPRDLEDGKRVEIQFFITTSTGMLSCVYESIPVFLTG